MKVHLKLTARLKYVPIPMLKLISKDRISSVFVATYLVLLYICMSSLWVWLVDLALAKTCH